MRLRVIAVLLAVLLPAAGCPGLTARQAHLLELAVEDGKRDLATLDRQLGVSDPEALVLEALLAYEANVAVLCGILSSDLRRPGPWPFLVGVVEGAGLIDAELADDWSEGPGLDEIEEMGRDACRR